MSTPKNGLEPITLKRASIADANKVRYRVYSTATEFVTVTAESALMAVRVAAVETPHKIIRELPGEGGQVDSKKLVNNEGDGIVLNASTQKTAKERMEQYFTELGESASDEPVLFVPMGIADLRSRGMTRARILPAEMLQEIIDAHTKNQEAAAAVTEPPAPLVEPAPEIIRPPELSQEEKLTKLADEVLVPGEQAPAVAPSAAPELSPEEVQKLLNE